MHKLLLSISCLTVLCGFACQASGDKQPAKETTPVIVEKKIVIGPMLEIEKISDVEKLKDAVKDGKVVFVKFYAPWCPHCVTLAPHFKAIAEQFADKATFISVNMDVVGGKLGDIESDIKGFPTIKVFKVGTVADTLVGGASKDKLKEFIEKQIK